MLDLDARVQLQKPEIFALEHELGRAGARVADAPRKGDRRLPQRVAQLRADGRRRALLEDLLVAPLDRALSLSQVDDLPVGVRQELNLHVARTLEEAFVEDTTVSEGGLGLTPCRSRRLVEFFR
jgi:hypothetical protein